MINFLSLISIEILQSYWIAYFILLKQQQNNNENENKNKQTKFNYNVV